MKQLNTFIFFVSISLSIFPALVSAANDASIRQQLFSRVDASFAAARDAKADVLAPANYDKAMKYYRSAEKRFSQNRGLDDIKEHIVQSESYLRKAMDASRIAAVTFNSIAQARSNAESANAAKYAPEVWSKAESGFRDAALRLEGGNVKSAQKVAGRTEPLYREAELVAVKENYLSGARNLIAQAKKMRADRYAPKTLSNAEKLLIRAEKELTQNRYDTDLPRDLARRARNEGKHAITISELAISVKNKRRSVEDIVRSYEKPLSTIAGEMDLVASLHNGYKETEKNILKSVARLQKKSGELDQCVILMEEMDAEVAKLEKQVGVKSDRLQAEAQIREHLANIESLFSRDEAQIFRQGQNLIIRMVGLNFDSGKSEIKPNHFGLLSKVKKAISMSPNGNMVIEGHTDSYGSDTNNLNLSEKRAEAVVQYLLANMKLNPARITAVGYGETRPIANNEAREGRAKNRRIDVVIKFGG